MNRNIIMYVYIIAMGAIWIIDDKFICIKCGGILNILITLVAVVFAAYAAYSIYIETKQRE